MGSGDDVFLGDAPIIVLREYVLQDLAEKMMNSIRMLPFEKHLEEKPVTRAQFGKKQDENTILGLSVFGDDVRISCDTVRSEQ
ncbi:hypothetical protein Tco_0104654 [Tanacetum coccineum]